ncbi:hypothetical protein AOLI_G00091740 [Acnodon oligacanthus]
MRTDESADSGQREAESYSSNPTQTETPRTLATVHPDDLPAQECSLKQTHPAGLHCTVHVSSDLHGMDSTGCWKHSCAVLVHVWSKNLEKSL